MADELTESSDKEAIYQRVVFLMSGNMTLKRACEIVEEETGQKWATTKQQFVRRGGSTEKRHGHCKLTETQEGVALSVAIVYSVMHEALTTPSLCDHVEKIFGIEVGKKWATGFMKRHNNELSKRKTKLLASKRVSSDMAEHVAEFIGQVETVSEVYPMKATNVVNYDETRVFIADNGAIRLEHVSKERAQKRGIKGRTIGSLLSFVAANGSVLMSVWIFKGSQEENDDGDAMLQVNFNIEHEPRYLRGTWKRYYAFTPSGFSNKELHANVMERFGKTWSEQNKTDHCWLFGDQLAAHKSVDTVEKALESRVLCWILPANTSHFLQPLDDNVFACFKQILQTLG